MMGVATSINYSPDVDVLIIQTYNNSILQDQVMKMETRDEMVVVTTRDMYEWLVSSARDVYEFSR
jgi:hypothetical protein